MPAYIRTKNIFDAKVNILIDNIFFQKADESNDVCHSSIVSWISKYPRYLLVI